MKLYNFEIGGTTSGDPFDLESMAENLTASTGAVKKTPQSFLGENSALVNLDNLVSASTIKPTAPTPAGKFLFTFRINKTYKYQERKVQYSKLEFISIGLKKHLYFLKLYTPL